MKKCRKCQAETRSQTDTHCKRCGTAFSEKKRKLPGLPSADFVDEITDAVIINEIFAPGSTADALGAVADAAGAVVEAAGEVLSGT